MPLSYNVGEYKTKLKVIGSVGYNHKLKNLSCEFCGCFSLTQTHTTNVKNMHPHRDSKPGPWITFVCQFACVLSLLTTLILPIVQDSAHLPFSMDMLEFENLK